MSEAGRRRAEQRAAAAELLPGAAGACSKALRGLEGFPVVGVGGGGGLVSASTAGRDGHAAGCWGQEERCTPPCLHSCGSLLCACGGVPAAVPVCASCALSCVRTCGAWGGQAAPDACRAVGCGASRESQQLRQQGTRQSCMNSNLIMTHMLWARCPRARLNARASICEFIRILYETVPVRFTLSFDITACCQQRTG